MTDLQVEVEPGGKTLGIHILEAEEPELPESDRANHLLKELLPRGARLDGKLQFGIHSGDAHIHLQENKRRSYRLGMTRASQVRWDRVVRRVLKEGREAGVE